MVAKSPRHAETDSRRFSWLYASLAALLLVIGAVAVVWALNRPSPNVAEPPQSDLTQSQTADSAPQSAPVTTPVPQPEPVRFTVVAGGDVLTHMPVLDDAWNGERYELSRLMAPAAPYIQGADLALCHMEVPVAPLGEAPTGYPVFRAPHETIEELKKTGWDGCSTASNHSVDQGYDGLVQTLDAFDEAGMGHAGTARSAEEAAQPQLYEIEKNGQTLKVAHIAFANNLNGLPIPSEAPWAINLNDVNEVLRQAQAARDSGADLVIVSYHCCDAEYISVPEDLQVEAANQLAASGLVDIMISHHAHQPKPMAHLPGGPRGGGMWVAYGTGNFISNQDEACCTAESSTGVLAFFHAVKAPDGSVSVPDASWSAVRTELSNHHTVRIVTAEGAADSPVSQEDSIFRHQITLNVMGTDPAPEQVGPPTDPGNLTVVPRAH